MFVAMDLYFAPLACSMVVRIVALELELQLDYRQVELFAKVLTADGSSYRDATPQALVPVLRFDDGESLTEVAAIVQCLVDAHPESNLLPVVGTRDRYRTLAWMSWVASEFHKRGLWVIANRETPSEAKRHAHVLATRALDHLEHHLKDRDYLVANRFTAADAYLAWALAVAPLLRVELGERPSLQTYAERIAARPSVAQATRLELDLLRPAMVRQAELVEARP